MAQVNRLEDTPENRKTLMERFHRDAGLSEKEQALLGRVDTNW